MKHGTPVRRPCPTPAPTPAPPPEGVVDFHLRGPAPRTRSSLTPAKVIRAIEAGLSIEELDALQSSLGIPLERLAQLLGISRATLHRRKTDGRLDRAESDRVVRFARLAGHAAEVLEGDQNARRWLTSPQIGLGGAVPLEYAVTEAGAREVEDLLGRIEHSVYS